MQNNFGWYEQLLKPAWAPPAELFGPIWTVLYILIILSFGYVGYLFFKKRISFATVLPFILNLVFNLLFTPILFGLRNLPLAAVDAVLLLVTLIWALTVIYRTAKWVVYVNMPYLVWVCFAVLLQITITLKNI